MDLQTKSRQGNDLSCSFVFSDNQFLTDNHMCGVTGEPPTLQLREKHVECEMDNECSEALVGHRGQITELMYHSIDHCP